MSCQIDECIFFNIDECIFFSTVFFPLFRLPFYYELKILFVLWLLSPATKGASYLYRKFIHPQLAKREKVILAFPCIPDVDEILCTVFSFTWPVMDTCLCTEKS